MSQFIRDLKFGYSPLLMKPAPRPRHTTPGQQPKQKAVFITREWKQTSVKTCKWKDSWVQLSDTGEPAIFPQF